MTGKEGRGHALSEQTVQETAGPTTPPSSVPSLETVTVLNPLHVRLT